MPHNDVRSKLSSRPTAVAVAVSMLLLVFPIEAGAANAAPRGGQPPGRGLQSRGPQGTLGPSRVRGPPPRPPRHP